MITYINVFIGLFISVFRKLLVNIYVANFQNSCVLVYLFKLEQYLKLIVCIFHRFSVQFTGAPAPQVSWFREGFEIQTSRDFQIMTTATRSTLYIPEVFPEDTGMFTVKINNANGMAQCKAMLSVQGVYFLLQMLHHGCAYLFITYAKNSALQSLLLLQRRLSLHS